MKNILHKKAEIAKNLLQNKTCRNCWAKNYISIAPGMWCYVRQRRPEFGICAYRAISFTEFMDR